jgi:hypothetical protein
MAFGGAAVGGDRLASIDFGRSGWTGTITRGAGGVWGGVANWCGRANLLTVAGGGRAFTNVDGACGAGLGPQLTGLTGRPTGPSLLAMVFTNRDDTYLEVSIACSFPLKHADLPK